MNTVNSTALGGASGPVGSVPPGTPPNTTNQGNIPFTSLESLDSTDFQEKKKHDKLKWFAIAGSLVIGGLTLYVSKGKIAEAWKKLTNKGAQSSEEDLNTASSGSSKATQPAWFNDLASHTQWQDLKKNSHFQNTPREELFKPIIARFENDHINALKAWAKKKPETAPTFDARLLAEMLNDPDMKPCRQAIAEECLFAKLHPKVHQEILRHPEVDVNRIVKIQDPEKPDVEMTLFHRLMEHQKYHAAELVSQDKRFNPSIPSNGMDFKTLIQHYQQTIPSTASSFNTELATAKTNYDSCFENWDKDQTSENYTKERQAWAIYQNLSFQESPERLASLINTVKS